MSSSSLVINRGNHPSVSVMDQAATTTASPTQGSAWGNAATSPWAKASSPAACSLSDVMSEQLAQEMQTSDEIKAIKRCENMEFEFSMGKTVDTSDDYLIAQMMQHEFDKDHDRQIKLEECKFNADSKVRVSYDNFRAVHPLLWDDDEDPDEEVIERPEVKEQQRCYRGRGISGKGKDIVTKHDRAINERRNANRATDQFPPEINVGDGLDLRLSNKVYNKLKSYSQAEAKRSHRLHEKKDHSTAEQSMDPKTRLILYKLVNNGTLEHVNGIISTGKESVVFHAASGSDAVIPYEPGSAQFQVPPPEVAIKVFKTTLTEFKNRADYVKGDVRFFKDEFKKQNPRKIMRLWADKESINLRRMARFGIPCPKVVQLRKHVLLMSFIGRDRVAAPKLKDAKLNTVDMQRACDQIVQNMKTMYRDCMLVHGDLSEYNILWHDDTAVMIDVSQAVDRTHPHAHEFLLRDCRNISQFFKKNGVHNMPDEYELLNDITGLGLKGEGKEFLMQVEDYEKHENTMRLGDSKKNYNFDFFFENATQQRTCEKHTGPENTSHCVEDEQLNPADVSNTDRVVENEGNTEHNRERIKRTNPAIESDVTDDNELSSSDDETDEETMLIFEKYLEERRLQLAKDSLEGSSPSRTKVSFKEGKETFRGTNQQQ